MSGLPGPAQGEKTRQEILNDIIARSKERKLEKARGKEEQESERERLDDPRVGGEPRTVTVRWSCLVAWRRLDREASYRGVTASCRRGVRGLRNGVSLGGETAVPMASHAGKGRSLTHYSLSLVHSPSPQPRRKRARREKTALPPARIRPQRTRVRRRVGRAVQKFELEQKPRHASPFARARLSTAYQTSLA